MTSLREKSAKSRNAVPSIELSKNQGAKWKQGSLETAMRHGSRGQCVILSGAMPASACAVYPNVDIADVRRTSLKLRDHMSTSAFSWWLGSSFCSPSACCDLVTNLSPGNSFSMDFRLLPILLA